MVNNDAENDLDLERRRAKWCTHGRQEVQVIY